MGFGIIWSIVKGFCGPFLKNIVGPFISKYWKQIIAAVIMGITLWHIHSLNKTIIKRDATIVQLTQDLQTTKNNLQVAQDAITDQNKKLTDAANVAKNNQKDLDTLGNKLKQDAEKNKSIIDKLRAQPAPKTCDDTLKYLQDNLNKIEWPR